MALSNIASLACAQAVLGNPVFYFGLWKITRHQQICRLSDFAEYTVSSCKCLFCSLSGNDWGNFISVRFFLSRLVSIPLLIDMCVAYLTAHIDALKNLLIDPDQFISATPFNFLLVTLIVLAFGPGKFSIDYAIARDECRRGKG